MCDGQSCCLFCGKVNPSRTQVQLEPIDPARDSPDSASEARTWENDDGVADEGGERVERAAGLGEAAAWSKAPKSGVVGRIKLVKKR